MKNQKNENTNQSPHTHDLMNLPRSKGLSNPNLSHMNNMERIQNLNPNQFMGSRHNESPSIFQNHREDMSLYGKQMDYSQLHHSRNLKTNMGLSSFLGNSENLLNRKVNNSVLSYEANDTLLKNQKSIQNGSTYNFLNQQLTGSQLYMNPNQSFLNYNHPSKPAETPKMMNPLSTMSNQNDPKFFFGNSQYTQHQAQKSGFNFGLKTMENLRSHKNSRNYELSLAQDGDSLADKGQLSIKSFGNGSQANLNEYQKKFKREFGDDIYAYIKQCIKKANSELEAEKRDQTDLQNLTISQHVLKQTPSFEKSKEIKPSRVPPDFNGNFQESQVPQKKLVKLKIDFEPLGTRISGSDYPEMKKEVMMAIQKIGDKYAHVMNLELQIKDMIIPREFHQNSKFDLQPNLGKNSTVYRGLSSKLLPSVVSDNFTQKADMSHKTEFKATIVERVSGKEKNESLQILKNELFNVLENSFDDKIIEIKKKKIQNQIVESTYLILKNLNCSSEKEYYKENFFNFFNLQLNIDPVKINSFSLKMKIRIACLLFCKYVNRNKILSFFEDFYEFVDISDLDSAMKSIRNSEDDCDNLLSNEKDLWDLFYFRNFAEYQKEQTSQDIFSKKGVFLLRKLLILFIMLMDLCKSFLNLKTGEEIFKTHISLDVHRQNHQNSGRLSNPERRQIQLQNHWNLWNPASAFLLPRFQLCTYLDRYRLAICECEASLRYKPYFPSLGTHQLSRLGG